MKIAARQLPQTRQLTGGINSPGLELRQYADSDQSCLHVVRARICRSWIAYNNQSARWFNGRLSDYCPKECRMVLRSLSRRAPRDAVEVPPGSVCANCGAPLSGPESVARAQPVAWHSSCAECFELCQADMELVDECCVDGKIQVYRCRKCGSQRSCRPGWRTRCHVCLE